MHARLHGPKKLIIGTFKDALGNKFDLAVK